MYWIRSSEVGRRSGAAPGAGIVIQAPLRRWFGDAGVTVAENVGIAVTTGTVYTVATALEGIRYAADLLMNISVL